MQYGYFDHEQREYVITNPRTPTKWINYLGSLAFGGFVDHTGGAVLCKGDPGLNRITWYTPQLPASQFQATTLYLRFPEGNGYRVFSPFFVPTLHAYDLYECHVGLGYSRFISEAFGLRTEITVFVPIGQAVEIRQIKVTNIGTEKRRLDAIPVVEVSHPDAAKQYTNNDWVPQTMITRAVTEAAGTRILIQYPFMFRDIKVNYFTSDLPASSFETDRARFLGANEYGTWADPLSLHAEELSNYEAQRAYNIGALLHPLGELAPGESRCLITQLGQAASLEEALPTIQRYRDPASVAAALEELAQFWATYLEHLQVETPDAAMNAMLNVHNPRQCYITLNWSRYLSLYQVGLGSRGIGYRDSCQDVMGVVSQVPGDARVVIERALSVQKADGSAMHQYYPATMEASIGDAAEGEGRPKYYGDDHLWAILATAAYLKETGDLAFLDKQIAYYDTPASSDSVLGHLRRALEFTQTHVGAHGLPLLGYADWNDTVNLRQGAESMFVAHLYGRALLEMIALMDHLCQREAAELYRAHYATMRERVNTHGWDGAWYVRYFDCDGSLLGSSTNEKGQIYLNGQSWAVLSGFAPDARALQALDSAYTRLNTRFGLKLSMPGYDGFDPNKGGITTYPPGAKENGGIFLHTNPWMMIAETMVGRGARAFQYYQQINPAAKNDLMEIFESEPYAYPQNTLSDERPQFGLARNSWLTGTASWSYQAATQYILGVRPTYTGLEIDPCIPEDWAGFSMVRAFRDAVYRIEVTNPDHVSKGVRSIAVDGRAIEGRIIPIFADGRPHSINVVMG